MWWSTAKTELHHMTTNHQICPGQNKDSRLLAQNSGWSSRCFNLNPTPVEATSDRRMESLTTVDNCLSSWAAQANANNVASSRIILSHPCTWNATSIVWGTVEPGEIKATQNMHLSPDSSYPLAHLMLLFPLFDLSLQSLHGHGDPIWRNCTTRWNVKTNRSYVSIPAGAEWNDPRRWFWGTSSTLAYVEGTAHIPVPRRYRLIPRERYVRESCDIIH
jgi:hypothetical protein